MQTLFNTKYLNIFCKENNVPLCSKCSTMEDHHGHKFDDLDEICAEKYALKQGEFLKIQKYFLPTSQTQKTYIEKDVIQIKEIIESIRTSIKLETESLKNLADEVTSENIEHTYTSPVQPVFTAGEFTKQDVAKLLGRVNAPNTKTREKINPAYGGSS